ncbi:MAG: hypothetical protein OSA98_16265 [Rubripirellula sp.]|nr:hypothetical protein [Rubripirellula sp.]
MTTNNRSQIGQHQFNNQQSEELNLKRKKKKKRRSREERGLPLPDNLASLARTYLEVQKKLWPELVGKELPAKITDQAISEMADTFRTHFLSLEVEDFQAVNRNPGWDGIASAYVRYSCDQSNPRSLDQQLKLALGKAKETNILFPGSAVSPMLPSPVPLMSETGTDREHLKSMAEEAKRKTAESDGPDSAEITLTSVEAGSLGSKSRGNQI